MSKKKHQEYITVTIRASVRIGLAGCEQSDEIEVEIPANASEEQQDDLKFEAAREWANEFIEVSYKDK